MVATGTREEGEVRAVRESRVKADNFSGRGTSDSGTTGLVGKF
jgi:hypothetical protein